MVIESIPKYAGGGGVAQASYFRNLQSAYQTMLADPQLQQLNGFGEYDFLQKIGVTVTGEARLVYNEYMDHLI